MAKNNALIEYMKQIEYLKKKIEVDAISFYSCLALCLTDEKYNWSTEQIQDLFADIGCLWQQCVDEDIDMVEWCLNVANIDVRTEITRPNENDE